MSNKAWRVLRAKYLFHVVDERAGALRPPLLSVSIHHGVVPRSSLTEDEHRADDLSAYKRCDKGDIVLNRMRAFQGAIGIAPSAGLVSPDYIVLRPRLIADARFLHHLFRSRWFVSEMASRLRGIGSVEQGNVRTPRINAEDLGDISVALPERREQRAIAGFLDRETARIDALIAAKRRMIDVLRERQALLFDSAMNRLGFHFPMDLTLSKDWPVPPGWLIVRLSQVLRQLTNGFVGPTRDILVETGVKYIQSLHIKGGEIDFGRRPFYVRHEWHDERPRIHLRPDDVLVVQTGDIGQVAVVPKDFGEASCHALQILRVRPDLITGKFLAAYLRSPFGYDSLLSMATGALHPHLEGSIRAVQVVVPPLSQQEEILHQVSAGKAPLVEAVRHLDNQIGLLVEHRQALITAAVTGELDVAGVAA